MDHAELSKQEIARTITTVSAFASAIAELSGDPLMPLQQVQLLLHLYIHGRILQSELPNFTGVESSAISRNISKLGAGSKGKKGLGLVEAYEDTADRRWNIVRLTLAGKLILEQAATRAGLARSKLGEN